MFVCGQPAAPEQQRLDDAIGFLRDHTEIREVRYALLSTSSSLLVLIFHLHVFYVCLVIQISLYFLQAFD